LFKTIKYNESAIYFVSKIFIKLITEKLHELNAKQESICKIPEEKLDAIEKLMNNQGQRYRRIKKLSRLAERHSVPSSRYSETRCTS